MISVAPQVKLVIHTTSPEPCVKRLQPCKRYEILNISISNFPLTPAFGSLRVSAHPCVDILFALLEL